MAVAVGAATRTLASVQQLQQTPPPPSCNPLAVSRVVCAQPCRYEAAATDRFSCLFECNLRGLI
jgi:hypothetical protein